jgi:hypothetical protein
LTRVALLGALFLLTAPITHAAPLPIHTPDLYIHATTTPTANATVNLFCRLKSGNTMFTATGSGVFISERGVILTNAHVAQYFLFTTGKGRVRGSCDVRTGSPATTAYTAELLYLPPTWITANAEALKKKERKGSGEGDFALLYVTGPTKGNTLPERFPYVQPSFLSPVQGDTVTIAGYPTYGQKVKDIQKELKLVTTTSSITNVRAFSPSGSIPEVITIASSTAASAGISGGPVVRTDNTLAGIVVAKSDTELRAITPFHMNSYVVKETGTTLTGMLLGDLAARAATNRALITPKQVILLRDALLRIR